MYKYQYNYNNTCKAIGITDYYHEVMSLNVMHLIKHSKVNVLNFLLIDIHTNLFTNYTYRSIDIIINNIIFNDY